MEPNVLDKANDKANELAANGQRQFGEIQEKAAGVVDKAKDTVNSVAQSVAHGDLNAGIAKTKEAAATVAHSVTDAAHYVGQKASDATASIGSVMENTGHYLKEDGLNNIATDLTNLVRRNPLPALMIAVGFGFLLAQSASTRRM